MTPTRTKTSAGMETVDETVARAKAQLGTAYVPPKTQPTPSVSANDLANPPAPVNLPQPTPPTIPSRVDTTVNNVLGSIRSTSENARRLEEERAAFGSFAEGASGFDIQSEQLQRFGVTPEKLRELEDIQLQLADRKTESNLIKTRIEGAAGQTVGQAGREVTQEDRESAVRDSGLAARAAVLQGNIETGRALANDAVNIALQDRTFQANAKLEQINYLQGIVDEETAQLLEGEKRTYEAELAAIKEVKDATANAIVNGASQSEVAQLTDPNVDDATKLSLAQAITARGVNQMRNLDIAQAQASIANSYSAIDDRNERLKLAQQAAALEIDTANATAGQVAEAKGEKALGMLQSIKELKTHPGFGAAVGPNPLARVEYGAGVGVFTGLFTGNKSDFKSDVDMLANTLTLENMDLLKGPATDKDVEIVANSMSKLQNMDVGEAAYFEELNRLEQAAQRIVDNVGVTPEQAQFYFGADADSMNEIDNVYGGATTTTTTPLLNWQ